MPSVRFAENNSSIHFSLPAAADFTGAVTLAALVRRRSFPQYAQFIFGHHNAAGSVCGCGLEFGEDAINSEFGIPNILINNGPTAQQGMTILGDTFFWYLIVGTRGAGAFNSTKIHIKNVETSDPWVHDLTPSTGAPPSCVGGTIRVGEWMEVEDLDANVALIAGWDSLLSDTQVEALGASLATSDFTGHEVLPKYVCELTQLTGITDLMGNGVDQLESFGDPTLDAAVPAGWTFGSVPTGPPSQQIDITNTGKGTLNWTATKTQSWLSLSPGSGSTTSEIDTLSVSVDPEGLTPGQQYTDTITIAATGASNTPRTIDVVFNYNLPPSIGRSPTTLTFNWEIP